MIKASNSVIEAFTALEHNRDFRLIIDWIKQSRDDTLLRMVSEDSDLILRRKQGAASDLTEILRLADEARAIMDKIR